MLLKFSKSDLARSSRIWLASLGMAEKNNPEILISTSIGVYLCDVLEGIKEHSLSLEVYSHLSKYLIHLKCGCLHSVSTKLLLACAILLEYGVKEKGVEKFLMSAVNLHSSDEIVSIDYFAQSLLLYRMGFSSSIPHVVIDLSIKDAITILRSNDDELNKLCNWFDLVSQHGKKIIKIPNDIQEDVSRVIPVLTIQKLRLYDLHFGSRFLRAQSYFEPKFHASFKKRAVEFLVEQQRMDGSFGFFGFDQNYSNKNTDNNKKSIYLSTTIDCLWAISEVLVPKFRLFWGRNC